MDKFIGFDVDHKHTLACVTQAGRPNRRLGVPGGRPDGQEQGQDRPLSVESGGSPGYDGGLRFENWDMSA